MSDDKYVAMDVWDDMKSEADAGQRKAYDYVRVLAKLQEAEVKLKARGDRLSTAEQRIRELEREALAWRALVYHFRFHEPYQLLDGSGNWRCHGGDPKTKWQHLAYGNGPSPQAAAIDLAEKLGLISKADTNASEGK